MKNPMKINIFLIFIVLACFTPVTAQQPAVSPGSTEDLQKRLAQMEAEMKTMREELARLKQTVLAVQTNPPATANTETNVAAKTEVKAEPKTDPKPATKPAPAAEVKQTRNLGIDIGSARLTPYGTIYFNAFGNSGGTNNEDLPLFATPTGPGNFSASVRQTRLGLRLEGAKVGRANLKAVLEADFFGGFPAVGIGENFSVVRLRLANVRLDWEKTSVTVGQDWMVFAPVSPTSLAAAAIPQMAAAGNNWARLPQIKIERKFGKNLTWAGAILAPQTGDFSTTASFFLLPTSGASSRVPFIQSRLAFAGANWLGTKKAGSIGFSAHYGRSRVFTGASGNIKNDIDSLGLALDWSFPLAETLSLSGEAFFGRNLGGFQGGVFQGYNNDFAILLQNGSLAAGGVRSISTRGGWTQLGFTPRVLESRLSFYGSVGLDDPRDEDLVTLSRRDFRTRNLAFAFDSIYKLTPQFSIGAEIRRFQTGYFFSGRRNANHVNLSAAYSF